jgi:hypothetical protein
MGSSTTCEWQEYHRAGGTLIEMHSGAAGDPEETAGSWSVVTSGGPNNPDNGKITHNYGSGGIYTYNVHDNGGGSYSFCGPNGEFAFSVKPGKGRCP